MNSNAATLFPGVCTLKLRHVFLLKHVNNGRLQLFALSVRVNKVNKQKKHTKLSGIAYENCNVVVNIFI